MDDREPTHASLSDRDHWDAMAAAMDLSIEGQRLIAHEIAWEARWLWQKGMGWARGLTSVAGWWKAAPPA